VKVRALLTLVFAAAPALGEPLHVPLRETRTVMRAGATAAYAVDATVADVSARDGTVTVHGRAVGVTPVTVVSGPSLETFELIIDAPPPNRFATSVSASQDSTAWEALYDSGTTRLTNSLDVLSRSGERVTRLTAVNVARLGERDDGDARNSFAWASLELAASGRRLVLLDQLVDHSALTLEGTALRGVHYSDGALELHGGFTSPLLYQDFLFPSAHETALGASYRIAAGRSAFTPIVYAFPSDSRYGSRGAMGSLLYDYGIPGERFRLRAEVGWGGKPGGALRIAWQDDGNRLWLQARHQPSGFAGIGVGRSHGTFLDAAWSSRLLPRLLLNLNGSFARNELPLFQQRIESSTAELRYALSGEWSFLGGATVGHFATGGASASSVTVPAGVSYEGAHAGAAALYRYQRNSANNRGGSGGRLTVRGSWSQLQASAIADYQRDAATVDLVFRDEPDLARLFAELGLAARTPDDLARILRDNPILADLGYIEGVTVNLHPWRLQLGADVAWLPQDEARQQLRFHVLVDRTRGVARLQQIASATVSYSRRIAGPVDGIASYTFWMLDVAQTHASRGWAFGLGFRTRFDAVPHVGSIFRSNSVRGLVYRDDDSGGTPAEGFSGVRVRLDGGRETVTDATGHFQFEAAGEGPHRVDVIAPADSYFTTRSSALVDGGGEVSFAIARSPARLAGYVRGDTGAPIGGVIVRLTREGRDLNAITDSTGRYAFAVAPGEYALAVENGSVPPGYDVADLLPRRILLSAAEPSSSDYVVSANRSISGRIKVPTQQRVAVWIVGFHEARVMVDREGRYVFRNLKPGNYTIAADLDGHEVHREVHVRDGPTLLREIDFGGD
jgi:hypothetical protein